MGANVVRLTPSFRYAYKGHRVVSFLAGECIPGDDEAARYALDHGLTRPSTTIAPRWAGETALLIASGPSLHGGDLVEARKRHALGRLRAIAVNDSWKLAPWADVLYAADADWWNYHKGVPGFSGERWAPLRMTNGQTDKRAEEAIDRWDLNWVPLTGAQNGISTDPGIIHAGHHSGFQALNLAVLLGATRILLLGYDYQANGRSHFFGDHPEPLRRSSPLKLFREAIEKTAGQLADMGIEVANCSRETALTCFPRMRIKEALDT